MLTITLGSQASGSTWLFNVVRELFRAAGRPATSASADDANDALDGLPLALGDVVLKSHSLDQRLIRIAQLSGARMLVSTRDPRDSVVSQRDRFGSTLRGAAAELSRSFATINMLPAGLPTMRFLYEDRFMDKAETVASIARFLDLAVPGRAIAEIDADLRADAIRARLDRRAAAHDPETQWHRNHIGDGRSGKWRERLDAVSRDIVDGCLSPLASPATWRDRPLLWSAELFEYRSGFSDQPSVPLPAGGEPAILAWGPYLHLPAGRWRATPRLRLERRRDAATIEADAYQPWSGATLARAAGPVGREGAPALTLDFEHHDHFQSVELRLRSRPGAPCTITFAGWNLAWRGDR